MCVCVFKWPWPCDSWTAAAPTFLFSVTDPDSEFLAPAVVIGPKDTTVVAGREVALECIANARYISFMYILI